jgi:release factor glutamine methyltransferase
VTIADEVAAAVRTLGAAGFSRDDAGRDAAVLARDVLGWDTATWLVRQCEAEPEYFSRLFRLRIARRATHEPVAYITGEREFYGRSFVVNHHVLIPRPETELVIDAAIGRLRHARDAGRPDPVVIDVGTGSGCLVITLAREWPSAHLVATDISPDAVAVARANAARQGVEGRIEFRAGAHLAGFDRPIDVLVTNPPYIPTDDRASLAADVVEHEPHVALFAGQDGLDVIREIARLSAGVLAPGGALVMEIGAGQADAVTRLLGDAGLSIDAIMADLQGIPRVVVATGLAPIIRA